MKDQRVIKGENLISLLYLNDWLVPSSIIDKNTDEDVSDEINDKEIKKIIE